MHVTQFIAEGNFLSLHLSVLASAFRESLQVAFLKLVKTPGLKPLTDSVAKIRCLV